MKNQAKKLFNQKWEELIARGKDGHESSQIEFTIGTTRSFQIENLMLIKHSNEAKHTPFLGEQLDFDQQRVKQLQQNRFEWKGLRKI